MSDVTHCGRASKKTYFASWAVGAGSRSLHVLAIWTNRRWVVHTILPLITGYHSGWRGSSWAIFTSTTDSDGRSRAFRAYWANSADPVSRWIWVVTCIASERRRKNVDELKAISDSCASRSTAYSVVFASASRFNSTCALVTGWTRQADRPTSVREKSIRTWLCVVGSRAGAEAHCRTYFAWRLTTLAVCAWCAGNRRVGLIWAVGTCGTDSARHLASQWVLDIGCGGTARYLRRGSRCCFLARYDDFTQFLVSSVLVSAARAGFSGVVFWYGWCWTVFTNRAWSASKFINSWELSSRTGNCRRGGAGVTGWAVVASAANG